MRVDDFQVGRPNILFRGTKSAIEALTGVPEGAVAYATDTDSFGTYSGSVWSWVGAVREKLASSRTYYVRTDGSDSNDGLTNSSGGAFRTIQKAVNTVSELDINGQTVTIQIGDGTYTGSVTLKNVAGYSSPGNLVIQGNSGTPTNVVLVVTGSSCFSASFISSVWDIKNMQLKTVTAGSCINVTNGATVRFSGIDFGQTATYHLIAADGAGISCIGNYTITGGAASHIYCQGVSSVGIGGVTILFNANAAFTTFAKSTMVSSLICLATINTNSKTITGERFSVDLNAIIFVAGGGGLGYSYFPGTSPATYTIATGGQYQ